MAAGPPLRLILVDDDDALVRTVAAVARDAYPSEDDLAIDVACTIEAAREHVQRAAAAGETRVVVVSDFHVPPSATTGIQFLQETARLLPTGRLVLMTGREPEELASLLAGVRLDAFLAKPFTFDRVRGLLVALGGSGSPGTRVPVQSPPGRAGLAPGASAAEADRSD